MKYAILFLLPIVFVFCRSNRDFKGSVQTHTENAATASSVQKDSTASQAHRRDSTSDIKSEKQYLRTTWYRPDGTIRKIQEAGHKAKQSHVAVSDTGSSAVHVSENKTDSTRKINLKKLETEELRSFTDSRPIQGVEWIWVILAVVIVTGIICSIIIYKIRLK